MAALMAATARWVETAAVTVAVVLAVAAMVAAATAIQAHSQSV